MIRSVDPRTGRARQFTVGESTEAEVDAVCRVAANALRSSADPKNRVELLERAAIQLEQDGDNLIDVAEAETALGSARLGSELGRTCSQFRFFADVVDEGSWWEATIDHARDEAPVSHPEIRRYMQPIGPVGVFGAANFPFAFSVAGGDTASALAAGCPVIIKAHPSHPELSVRVFEVLRGAAADVGQADAIAGLLHGEDAGVALVQHPALKAVAFTGSLAAGRLLAKVAADRDRPIPFYGELGSLNPVVITRDALESRWEEIVEGLTNSFNLGVGQFCTKPGLIMCPADRLDSFVDAVLVAVSSRAPATMLNASIQENFRDGVGAVRKLGVAVSSPDGGPCPDPGVLPVVAWTHAGKIIDSPDLVRECFGPFVLVVGYSSIDEIGAVVQTAGGTLAAALHASPADPQAEEILDLLSSHAGRVVWNGWPTGVAVTWAMQHGGPFPASTMPTSTSVGAGAMRRFLRPVALQDLPSELQPPPVRDNNPLGIPQRVDGKWRLP